MKFKLFPVIFTAAATSVMTLFAVSHFQEKVPYLGMAQSRQLPVNYAAYTGAAAGSAVAPPASFEAAAESSVKAVVHIKTSTEGRVITDNSMGDVFSQLFGQRQYYIPPQAGSGSGVVVSADGYIVTNNHVIADASTVTVTFNNRHTSKARVVGTDPSTDIAVLKVEDGANYPYMEFGNSDDVKLGQWVLAVGFPLNLDATVTAGIVSAKGRSLGINKTQSASAIESFIQTDAAVNPGNSGGALVNPAGQLVGINSAIASPTGSYAGYSYAIPANIVRKAVNDLMKYGSVQRAYMGVEYLDNKSATPEQLTSYGADKCDGVYVINVRPNSGAGKAGLQKGDFIMQINGTPVTCPGDIQGQVARYQPGDNISIMYNRGGKQYSATVMLTNMNGTTEIIKKGSGSKLLGATFKQVREGLEVVDLGKGPLAKQTNMGKGFVITGVNDMPVKSASDLQQILTSKKSVQIAGYYPGKQGMYYFALNNVDAYSGEE
ncbi:MAG: trypsin-like peptidase domain-containing protein [Bacteroidota bacterium]